MRRLASAFLFLFSLPLAAQSIAFISDLNGRYGSTSYHSRVTTAVDIIADLRPDTVISTGDMVAGQTSRLDSAQLTLMWRAFNRTVADPLAQAKIPLIVAVGNHDGSAYPEFALEREHFEAQWRARPAAMDMLPGSEWPTRYAARLGPILLIAFDATRPGKLAASERQWIERALRLHGSDSGATIVFSHLPIWPLASGREHEIIDDSELLQLLHQYGVDVYASGHHHAYYAGVDEAGMVHLFVGALGGNARSYSGLSHAQPHSFALLTVTDGTVSVSARAAPGFEAGLPVTELPEKVPGPLGVLHRVEQPVPLRP